MVAIFCLKLSYFLKIAHQGKKRLIPPLKNIIRASPKQTQLATTEILSLTLGQGIVRQTPPVIKAANIGYIKIIYCLLTSTSISMTVKSAPSLSVKSALLYHKYILVIGAKLNIFAIIVAIFQFFSLYKSLHRDLDFLNFYNII